MSESTSIRAAIVGATGYTGAELLRLLCAHPHVEVACVTSREKAGTRVDAHFMNMRGHCDLEFETPDVDVLARNDVVFFATPHGTAMHQAGALLERGVRVIDLSADFRLQDTDVFAQWYGQPHAAPDLLKQAVYGLPERNADALRDAQLIAAPGCYPTAVQLGFAPLLEQGLVDTHSLIADCKSGTSGAGRGASVAGLLAEASDSFKAYAASGHRHLPEIRQGLAAMSGSEVGLVFVPHLLPTIRGIHATLYCTIAEHVPDDTDWQQVFEQRYAASAFVDVLPAGSHPEIRSVRGSNLCRIAVHRAPHSRTLVVLAVEDNLVKGAAGQAIQAMNIACDLPETSGLSAPALMP